MSKAASPASDQHQSSGSFLGLVDGIDVDRFLADPSDCLGQSQTRLMGLPPETLATLHIAGLQKRFAQLRDSVPMLKRLADNQGVETVVQLNDALPLLFDHSTYKSYPVSLLDKQRFGALTSWLDKLTSIDLSGVDASKCRSIDEWMQLLRETTPLSICHTSGTSGSFSFLPWSKREWRVSTNQHHAQFFREFGDDSPPLPLPHNVHCVYPFFRNGGMAHTIVNDYFVASIAGAEERFHAAYPGRLSADLMLLAARRRAAAAKGQLGALVVSPEMEARREEFEAQQCSMPQHLAEFSARLISELAGQRVFITATSTLLLAMAERGLSLGQTRVFHPSSVIITGGGGKGVALPENWQKTVRDFLGVERLHLAYGMSEMAGINPMCAHGHYHVLPWIIPFVLDPGTNEALPRAGTVTGRLAFYDLIPDTRWGGFISGDEVTLNWDGRCPCGRTTAYLLANIQRLSNQAKYSDGEEKLSCASTAEAYEEAMDFLNDGTV